jgi:hypothetical protein
MKSEISKKKQDEIIEKEEGHHHEVEDRMTKLENIIYHLVNENCELREVSRTKNPLNEVQPYLQWYPTN